MRGIGAKTQRADIFLPGGHFGTADQLFKNHCFAMISKRNREPIIAKRKNSIGNIVKRSLLQSQKVCHYVVSSLNRAPVKRGTTVLASKKSGTALNIWNIKATL